jgi:hypothetical protein
MRTKEEMAAYQKARREKLRGGVSAKDREPFEIHDLRDLKCGGCTDKEKQISLRDEVIVQLGKDIKALQAKVALLEGEKQAFRDNRRPVQTVRGIFPSLIAGDVEKSHADHVVKLKELKSIGSNYKPNSLYGA